MGFESSLKQIAIQGHRLVSRAIESVTPDHCVPELNFGFKTGTEMRKDETCVIHDPEFGGSSKKAGGNMDVLVNGSG